MSHKHSDVRIMSGNFKGCDLVGRSMLPEALRFLKIFAIPSAPSLSDLCF